MSEIVTGEAVLLDLRVARIGSRSVARGVDFALQLGIVLVLALTFGQLRLVDGTAGQAFLLVLYVGLLVGYPVGFETLWQGRTPGKAAMGLRVVRDDGGPIRFRHALIRGLIGAIVEMPGVLFFVPAVISSLASERGKRLGDRAAGTVVVQERLPSRPVAFVPMPAPLAQWASTLDLSRVDNDLALGIRSFFERATELSPQARDYLGHQLTSAVVAAISAAPPQGTPGWAVLAAVLAERRRRDEIRLAQQRQAAVAAGVAPHPDARWGSTSPSGRGSSSGWGSASPVPWGASAPATGPRPPVGPPPPVSPQPYYGSAPLVPPPPAPSPAPPAVPAPEPPPDGFHPPS